MSPGRCKHFVPSGLFLTDSFMLGGNRGPVLSLTVLSGVLRSWAMNYKVPRTIKVRVKRDTAMKKSNWFPPLDNLAG